MELEIQKWVRKIKPFDEESEELFNEAIECYKVGANKSAFIMSYLAYEKTIQNRILSFEGIPLNMTIQDWNKIKEDINDEYYWEKNISNQIKRNDGIFKLTNKKFIVSKLETYKITRDTCIHGKLKKINSSVVEEFWDFLKDNISKFNINGGKEYFKEALFKAFRDRNEPINITYDDLLYELSGLNLTENELIEVWIYLDEHFKQLYGVSDEDIKEFWNKILLNSNNKTQESFIKFTRQKCNNFIKFYRFNNELLNLSLSMSDGVTFKKEVLYEWIKDGTSAIYRNELFWDFILDIIKYVHDNDLKGFWKLIDIDEIRYIPSNDDCKILKEKHFFEEMKSYIISELEYDYNKVFDQQKRLNFTTCIIKNSLDIDTIKKLAKFWNDLYTHSYTGTNNLRYSLEQDLFVNDNFKKQVEQIVTENEFEFITNNYVNKMIEHMKRCLF